MEGQRYPDAVLFQRIEQYFKPCFMWQHASRVYTAEELWQTVNDLMPGYFNDYPQLERIMLALHFQYNFNEHNDKCYWLIDLV